MAGPMNPYDAPEPERRGMSGTSKVVLAFGIGCGVLLLLCCGVIGIGGYFAANYAQDSFSEDPAKAREVTDEIAQINIPDVLEPKASIDARVPFTGERLMTWAFYASADGEDFLILAEFGPMLADTGDLEREVRKSMRESGTVNDEEVDVIESETYDTKIHDEDASFQIAKVEGRNSGNEYWQATGQFTGDGGPALLILRLSAEEFSKEQVLDIIKSME
jgi:hypothetical protein